MPWSKNSDLPDGVKVLPQHAQTIFRSAANSWLGEHAGDDVTAIQVGWAAVKKSYHKNDSGDWEKTETTESIVKEQIFTPKEELNIDLNNRKVRLNIIKSGWSYNGNLWEEKHLHQFANIIESNQGYKQRIDHKESGKFGRSILDWCATLSNPSVITKEGIHILQADTEVFEHPESSAAIWERIIKCPKGVGVSVDSRVTGAKTKKPDGSSGFKIEDVIGLHGADFVDEASAGGGVVTESIGHIYVGEEDDVKFNFEGILADYKNLRQFDKDCWDLFSAFQDLNWQIIRDKDLKPADKKGKIKELVDDLNKALEKIELPKTESKEDDDKKTTKEVIVKESIMPEITKVGDLISNYPTLVEAIKTMALDEYKTQVEVTESKEKFDTLTKDNEQLKLQVKESTDKVTALEAEKTVLTGKLDKYEVAEKVAKKQESINKLIEESKIAKDAITPEFTKALLNIQESDKFEADVKALLEDRKKVWEAAVGKKPKGFGPNDMGSKPTTETAVSTELDKAWEAKFGLLEEKK